jgi:hypothetical protein
MDRIDDVSAASSFALADVRPLTKANISLGRDGIFVKICNDQPAARSRRCDVTRVRMDTVFHSHGVLTLAFGGRDSTGP